MNSFFNTGQKVVRVDAMISRMQMARLRRWLSSDFIRVMLILVNPSVTSTSFTRARLLVVGAACAVELLQLLVHADDACVA